MKDRKRHFLLWRGLILTLLLLTNLKVSAQQRHGDGVDDVLQYLPYGAVVGLKAAGVESRDDWQTMLVATAGSWVMTAGVAYVLKHSVNEWRPDESDRRSFPSGHTAFAFAGATMLHLEYGHLSPWVSVAGYGVATLTAVDRVVKDRHHWYDVAAGVGIGILSAELTTYLTHRWFKPVNLSASFGGNRLDVAIRW